MAAHAGNLLAICALLASSALAAVTPPPAALKLSTVTTVTTPTTTTTTTMAKVSENPASQPVADVIFAQLNKSQDAGSGSKAPPLKSQNVSPPEVSSDLMVADQPQGDISKALQRRSQMAEGKHFVRTSASLPGRINRNDLHAQCIYGCS
jgi:hypothetical protein